jgi:hypothetical protein
VDHRAWPLRRAGSCRGDLLVKQFGNGEQFGNDSIGRDGLEHGSSSELRFVLCNPQTIITPLRWPLFMVDL